MDGSVFIDTNVLVYTVSDEPVKRDRAREVVASASEIVISAQVVSEFVNVCLRQSLLGRDQVDAVVDGFLQAYRVVPVGGDTIRQALRLERQYGYSWWDSVMLAAALEAGCGIVYTEDLQHGQEIEQQLRIVNPFSEPLEGPESRSR